MRFAHLSDIHLGFQREPALQAAERGVFEEAVSECISRKADFAVMSGDIFHVNIPGMDVQKHAFGQFRRLHEAGIPVYAVYGSHDHSPLSNSVIDLLAETGYVTKMTHEAAGGKIHLNYVRDPKTGAVLAGLSGLKAGKDLENYRALEREAPEGGSPKIFIFHGALKDMGDGERGEQMAASWMPRGFDYYAGGHLHTHREERDLGGLPVVVYPGTPFAGNWRDMVENSKAGADGVSSTKRGMVFAEYDGRIATEFVPLGSARYLQIREYAKGRRAESVARELVERASAAEAEGRIVVVSIEGELSSGKTSEIDIARIRQELKDRGAASVQIKSSISSKEYDIVAEGRSREEYERRTFEANIDSTPVRRPELVGERGVKAALDLFSVVRVPRPDNEKRADYEARITGQALGALELEDDT